MELDIDNCIECAVSQKPLDYKTKKYNTIEISSRDLCSNCGKEIRIRGIRLNMKKKFWGGREYTLTLY
jgi:hypothetical protein